MGNRRGRELFEQWVLFSEGLLLPERWPLAVPILGSSKGRPAARGSRTPDLLITNQLLYLLSYSGARQRICPARGLGLLWR